MKDKLSKTLGIFFVALLLLSAFPAFAITPHDADAMWIEPVSVSLDTATHSPGYTFTIEVWLNISSDDVFGVQVALYYNRLQLKAVDSDFTTGTENLFDGHDLSTAGPTIDTSALGNGSVLAFASCKGSDYVPAPCDGSFIWIEFEVLAAPGMGETLTSEFDIETETGGAGRNWVKEPDTLALIPITAYNGDYSYAWSAPTYNPHMAIEHDGFDGVSPPSVPPADSWPVYWGPYPPSAVGSSFDVKIYIENLAVGWDLKNASFSLLYNSTVISIVGGTANVTVGTWTTSSVTVTEVADAGQLDIFVEDYTPGTPSGKVLVATIKFTILIQQEAPPYPVGYYDSSKLTFTGVVLKAETIDVDTDPSEEGEVRILAIVALPMAWLEVSPNYLEFGPEPVIGDEFEVKVKVANLHFAWYVVAIQVRLSFDPTLLELVSVTEGPFMLDSRWNLYGTFFYSAEQAATSVFPHHVAIVAMLLPNASGYYDQAEFPDTINTDPAPDPTVATVKFRIIYQDHSCAPEDYTSPLDILPFWKPEDCHFIDQDSYYVPSDMSKIVNGTVLLKGGWAIGRVIDLYGGAYNAGYGAYPFPAPYGGQGPDNPMDLVIPQSEVKLFASVEYNCWPVQSKDVGFEIEGPFYKNESNPEQLLPKESYKIWAKLTARTNSEGVAIVVFRMPWPCENPEDIMGIWKVTATVNVADEIIMDTMPYYYEYLVDIFKVTTDAYYYNHDDYVHVCFSYRTHAMQSYPALFAIVITDELGVPFGMDASFETTVGGAEFCEWVESEYCVDIYIPKWAFTGFAYVHVSVYDKDPTEGGFAWAYEYAPLPEIYIMPY